MVRRSGSDNDGGCDGLTEKRKEKDSPKKKKKRRRRRRRQRGGDRDKECVKKKGVYLEEKGGLGGK